MYIEVAASFDEDTGDGNPKLDETSLDYWSKQAIDIEEPSLFRERFCCDQLRRENEELLGYDTAGAV